MRTPTSHHTPKQRAEREVKALEAIRIIVVAIAIAFLITHFIVASTVVEGASMEDTLHNGDRLFVFKQGITADGLKRSDVVVFHAPDENRDYIKRVIALPDEYVQIEEGMVYINGKRLDEPYINTTYTHAREKAEWLVGKDELFVMGDNRQEGASRDSRYFGTISLRSVVGRAVFRYFPFDAFGGF